MDDHDGVREETDRTQYVVRDRYDVIRGRYAGKSEICEDRAPTEDCTGGDMSRIVGKYYWDSRQGVCVFFYYKSCPGSNVFDSRAQCEETCRTPTFSSE